MYAGVVININHQAVDRVFTYRVPEPLRGSVAVGKPVLVPFGSGNRKRKGFVVSTSEYTDLDPALLKSIDSVPEKQLSQEEQLITLAIRIRERYGGTLYQCISTTLPAKSKTEERKTKILTFTGSDEELKTETDLALRKKHYAKLRLLEAFSEKRSLPGHVVSDRLNVTNQTIKIFQDRGLVRVSYEEQKGKSEKILFAPSKRIPLNEAQQQAVDSILYDPRPVHLLFGITGSGKTEVYMELIEKTLEKGREAIVLIPEIALTYQTVMRFYNRFGDRVSFVHSRLKEGEKAARFEEARSGRIQVMIGPRSALFTPFSNLGLIVVDECHESSYRSDQVPKYDAVETAIDRALLSGAKAVLGSASPSVSLYKRALSGEFGLEKLKERAVEGSVLPETVIVDMREELRAKNRSILSRHLEERIRDRLSRGEQIMLFLNRRGYTGAVSCRSCGEAVNCVHCSTAMTQHRNGTLKCHICGYERPAVRICPKCGSKLIGSFGIGTEKAEEIVKETFPGIRTLRMDADTTSGKEGHQTILEQFVRHEADVLIGTQMIVKGHDFPNVTLVGILAADLSLYVPDYRSPERTFQLLLQAEGRAGRGEKKGECVIQTYNPEHYAIQAASKQDYEAFYREEIAFRHELDYPPEVVMTRVRFSGKHEKNVRETVEKLCGQLSLYFQQHHVKILGPGEENVAVVKDMYRYGFYYKAADEETSIRVKTAIENAFQKIGSERVYMTFES